VAGVNAGNSTFSSIALLNELHQGTFRRLLISEDIASSAPSANSVLGHFRIAFLDHLAL
jgi:hypothetical protein